MNLIRKGLPLALAILLACLTAARAADDAKELEPIQDRAFAAQALTAGRAQIKLSDLAALQTTNDKVKEFAQKTSKMQTKLVDRLTDATREMKVGLDYELAKELQVAYDRLAKLQGAEFDREYLKQVLDDHEKAVALFEREAKTGTVPEVSGFATETLPLLKDDLKKARTIWDGMKEKK